MRNVVYPCQAFVIFISISNGILYHHLTKAIVSQISLFSEQFFMFSSLHRLELFFSFFLFSIAYFVECRSIQDRRVEEFKYLVS